MKPAKVIALIFGLSVLFACKKPQPQVLELPSGENINVLSASKKYSFNSKKWTFKLTYRMNRKFESLDELKKKQDEVVGDMKKFWSEAHYLADNENCDQARITAEMIPETIAVVGSNTLSVTADFKKIDGKWDLFEGKMD